jgi:hypothetical protein
MVQAADLLIAGRESCYARPVAKRRPASTSSPHDRPLPRHPRRTHHLRAQDGPDVRRVRARPGPAGGTPASGRAPRPAFRRCRHPRQHLDPIRGSLCLREAGPQPAPISTQICSATCHADVSRNRWPWWPLDRTLGHRIPPSAAHRGARGGGVFLAGPEGLVGHAAQAQPHSGEPHRPGPPGARPMPCRRWRTWPCGTSATSRIPRSSGYILPGRHHHAGLHAEPSLAGVVDKLVVYPENMQKNLDLTRGLIHSQQVLLMLTEKGRERAKSPTGIVQRNGHAEPGRPRSSCAGLLAQGRRSDGPARDGPPISHRVFDLYAPISATSTAPSKPWDCKQPQMDADTRR